MTQLLIPESYSGIIDEIQSVLKLAKSKGLVTEHVELGVSPTSTFALIGNECLSISVEANTSCNLVPNELGLQVYMNVDFDHSTPQIREGDVYLNAMLEKSIVDVWKRGAVKANLANSVKDYDSNRHLACLLALLALDFPLEDSVTLSRALTNVSRETWPSCFTSFPKPILESEKLDIQVGWSVNTSTELSIPNVEDKNLGLYPVLDSSKWIKKVLECGVKTVQLRIKDRNQHDLEKEIIRSIELGQEYGVQVYINDYWQLAIKHGAYGVHLGQEDLEESNVQSIARAGIRLGLSTHGYYELLRIVQISPSYIALGHIFPTTTKEMPSKPQGLVRLALYQELIDTIPYGVSRGVPTVAIGGIDLSNAEQVWSCGVSSLAVVRAVTLADDLENLVRNFNHIMAN